MASVEELYKGFSPEEKKQIEQYAEEAKTKYDPKMVDEVNAKVSKWSREKWATVRKEGDEILRQLARLKGKPVSDPAVQSLVARHYANLTNFYVASPGMYKGLGQLYVQDERFRKNFDKCGDGLAAHLQQAIDYFCDSTLSKK